jgi:hexosaminidase
MRKHFFRPMPAAAVAALFVSMALLSSCGRKAGPPPVVSIIPRPVSLTRDSGAFLITPSTTIVLAKKGLENSAAFFNDYLDKYYGFSLKVTSDTARAANAIILDTGRISSSVAGAYRFSSAPGGVRITGADPAGTFYGIQTLIQLLPVTPSGSLAIGCVHIEDYPRFPYRGMMLDCGRHFFDTAFVKKFIDFIALHKMNTFHWHLTEDQGWRIQIKKYPRLTTVGAWRDSTLIGHAGSTPERYDHHRSGGFYTQEEIRAIVKYAAARYVTVIPEVEMPGHSMAAIAAYPELACQPGPYHVGTRWGVYDTILCPKPHTFNFYENVLGEVMQLFPSHYIHIGGDEAPKVTWNSSPYCRSLMKKLHLHSADELQSYFIGRIEKFLNGHGRDIIGWDEILQGGLAPNATVMSWRGEQGGIAAAKMHHRVIMSPTTYLYLDYYQSEIHDSLCIGGYLPLRKVYSFNPVPPELNDTEARYIEGVQANVWTEYMQWPTKVEYQIFPRMEAVAEIAWTPQGERNYDNFLGRLPVQFARYRLWGVSYSRAIYEVHLQPGARADHQGVNVGLSTGAQQGQVRYTTDGSVPDAGSKVYRDSIHVTGPVTIRAALFSDGKISGPVAESSWVISKATGRAVSLSEPPADKYNTGGSFTLVDGIVPAKTEEGSRWLGWQGGDMDAVIDLGKRQPLTTVSVTVADEPGSWIYAPSSVTVSVSDDGKHFRTVRRQAVGEDPTAQVRTLVIPVNGAAGRYVEVKAAGAGTIPQGKPGGGSDSWLFVGEIGVR